MTTIRGTFTVTMHPEPPYHEADQVALARATIDKTFHGPLAATGQVQFLSVRAGDHAAYVALERIAGSLDGRRGSFVVTHQALASPSSRTLAIAVVPGTGTGELVGLTGRMEIEIIERQHFYVMHYDLPPAA